MIGWPFSRLLAGLAVVVLGAACADEPVPAMPTWVDDVQPIIQANCGRCHGDPELGGSVGRFDTYQLATEVDAVNGKNTFNLIFLYVTSDQAITRMPPPPAPRLSDRQLQIFEKWSKNRVLGARAKEHAPTFVRRSTVEGATVKAGQDFAIDFVTADEDGETVSVEFRVGATRGMNVLGVALNTGVVRFTWSTKAVVDSMTMMVTTPAVAPGTYELFAGVADDTLRAGNAEVTVRLGTVTVTP